MLNHRNRNVQQLAVGSDQKNIHHAIIMRRIKWKATAESPVKLWGSVSSFPKKVVFTLLTFNLASHTHKMHFILLCLGLSSQSFKQGPVSLLLTNFELPFQKPKILWKLKWQFSLSFSLVFSKMTHLLFMLCVLITLCSHSFYEFFLRIRTRVRP